MALTSLTYLKNRIIFHKVINKIIKNNLFDEQYYFSANPDLDKKKTNAIIHFLEFGWKQGRNPTRDFDVSFYLTEYKDVKDSGTNPLVHFIKHGSAENRAISQLMKDKKIIEDSNLFDEQFYFSSNPDLDRKKTNAIIHFLEIGWKQGRNPNSDFDVSFYLTEYKDVKDSGTNPLSHFIKCGADEDRAINQLMKDKKIIKDSKLFDTAYYQKEYGEYLNETDCLSHYCNEGWKKGLNPTPNFQTNAYLEENPNLKNRETNPFAHYLEQENLTSIRNSKILFKITENDRGLEIGPSHNPSAPKSKGYNCEVLDHLSKDELIKKYKGHNVNLDNIEEVDYVWSGGSYVELINKTNHYDYIIASHVIEHTTDLISFLKDCHNLLKINGILSLAVPDKRYCFDHFKPVTFIGKVIDDHIQKKTIHSAGSVAEHYINAVKKNNAIAWDPNLEGEYEFVHDLDYVKQRMNSVLESQQYVDIHEYIFTPNSFSLIINDLNSLGLIDFDICSSESHGGEFLVILSKKTNPVRLNSQKRMELLAQIDS